MGERGSASAFPGESGVQKLAGELHTRTSPRTILRRLEALTKALEDERTGEKAAVVFLRAGGLPTLIRHLRGPASPPPATDPVTPWISAQAATALNVLLGCKRAILPELRVATAVITPLIDTLRDGPQELSRIVACSALLNLALAQPAHHKSMAEAGMMGLLLAFCSDMGDFGADAPLASRHATTLAARLARILMQSSTVAVRDLEQAIHAPERARCFGALLILQDCFLEDEGKLIAALKDTGVIAAVVATLQHESPFCVAAAAGALAWLAQVPGGAKASIDASGAAAALLNGIARSPPPGNLDKERGLFRWALFKPTMEGLSESVTFHDPTALAMAGLWGLCPDNGCLLGSFLEAGGVAVVTRVLHESSCTFTLQYTLAFIALLLLVNALTPGGNPVRCQELADDFFHAGLCQAAARVFGLGSKKVRKKLLDTVGMLFSHLSQHLRSAARAVLVAADAVERTLELAAEEDVANATVAMFTVLFSDPEGRRRMCEPAAADPLMRCISNRLMTADVGQKASLATKLLHALFNCSPHFFPAAVKGNITPGAVHALRILSVHPHPRGRAPSNTCSGLDVPLSCLNKLLEYDEDNQGGVRKAACDAGIVSVFCDLLAACDEPRIKKVLSLSMSLLLPHGGDGDRAGRLPQAIARLLSANPPVAAAQAADTLFIMCTLQPQLLPDCHTWGLAESLKRLTVHSDPETAAAAQKLVSIAEEWLDAGQAGAMARGLPHMPGQEQFSGAPDPTSPGGVSRARASPTRYASRTCAHCGITAERSEEGKLKECSACRTVRYCGKACQKADWPAHKATCKRRQAARGSP